MTPTLRPARTTDREAIAEWTRDTFSWGDYVAPALDHWLSDDDGDVVVAEVAGDVVGIARVTMLSPAEAWLQAVRVHLDHRQGGIGLALGTWAIEWAIEQQALVMRLAVENWNRAAQSLFEKLGFRSESRWVGVERGVGENSPVPAGNGGRRIMAPEGVRPAHSAEAEPALLSWSGGRLEHAARGLVAIGWQWRKLRLEDLVAAARRRELWEGRPGWAIAGIDGDGFRVSWISTTADDAKAMVRALIDQAASAGVERIEAIIPDVDWLRRPFQQAGCDPFPITLFARGL